jgi:hypothetical protein
MSYRLLVTTFYGDVEQFTMFCHCLNKNWQGNKDLIVCIGVNEDIQFWNKITDQAFSKDWKIEIRPSIREFKSGYTEMQANTVYHSVTSGVEDIIVWDCKDFILKPCDFNIFKINGKYRWTYIHNNIRMKDMGYDLSGLVDVPIDDIPGLNNIRPWIWNVEQLTRSWNHLNSKFGDYQSWQEFPGPGFFPGGAEIYGYYVYALKDPLRTIEFLNHREDNPLLFAGAYSLMPYEGLLQQVEEFDQQPSKIVWKHSRRHKDDKRFLEITKSVLIKYGIDSELIKSVYG